MVRPDMKALTVGYWVTEGPEGLTIRVNSAYLALQAFLSLFWCVVYLSARKLPLSRIKEVYIGYCRSTNDITMPTKPKQPRPRGYISYVMTIARIYFLIADTYSSKALRLLWSATWKASQKPTYSCEPCRREYPVTWASL